MKIFAFSDIHGSLRDLEKIIKNIKKKKPDIVILAGDITYFNREKDYFRILEPFFKNKIELLVLPGNHDENEVLNEVINKLSKKYNFDGVKNIEKSWYIKDNYIFVGFSANNIGPTVSTYDEEEAEEILKKLFSKIKNHLKNKKLITISHVNPYGLIEETLGFLGSYAWYEFIKKYKPLIHFHGHIHETEGTEYKIGNSKVFNLGIKGYFFDLESSKSQRRKKGKKKNGRGKKRSGRK